MLRRVFPFFSEYFRCYKNTAALKNRSSRVLAHTEMAEIAEIDFNFNLNLNDDLNYDLNGLFHRAK